MANFIYTDSCIPSSLTRITIDADTELTTDLLSRMINQYVTTNRKVMLSWEDYYKGKQEILNKPQNDKNRPCNKLVTNFCQNIVTSYLGYLAANNHIIYDSNDEESQKKIMDVLKYNDYMSEDQRFLKDALVYGVGTELMFMDRQANIRFNTVSPIRSFGVFDSSLAGDLLYFVRWYEKSEWENNNEFRVDVYTDSEILHYDMMGEFGGLTFVGKEPHYFSQCPANIFYLEDNESIFNCILTLQDAYNSISSDQNDDIDMFSSAYLVFTGQYNQKEINLEEIKKSRGILLRGDKTDVKFLTKDENVDSIKDALDRIKESVYSISQCPDFTSESFTSGVSSGIAIKYRLLNMEVRAATIEAAMKKALQRRIEIICGFVSLKMGEEIFRDFTINFVRNNPQDYSDMATMVNALNGVVSKETLFKQLPMVEDVNKEIERVNKEKKEMYDLYDDAFVTGDNNAKEEK